MGSGTGSVEGFVKPSKDAAFLNRVANDPSVFPWISLGLKPPLDLTALLEDEHNIFLANEFGGFLFIAKPDYVYDVHTQFLPEGRGRTALAAAREAAFHMFTKTDAMRIDTTVALANRAADRLTRMMGFSKWGETEVNGTPSNYYVLTLKEWARGLTCQ